MNDCFFCNCITNKDYALENEYAIARFDDYPVNDGHLEVIPKRHIKTWWETTQEEKKAINEFRRRGRTKYYAFTCPFDS